MNRGEQRRFWAYVTAFGALWGTMEVTLGAFLHTLRIPFVGVVLASASAALLLAQRQLMPRRGCSAATGVVAALCKSISPGGIILGPMVGITTEGLLVELALLPAPRSLVAALLGGALCALWAVLQGVVTQYLFFGARVVELYLRGAGRLGRWLGVSPRAGWWALGGLLLLVGLVGAVGAGWGRWVGRRSAVLLGRRGQS